jgi:hypothetical protein
MTNRWPSLHGRGRELIVAQPFVRRRENDRGGQSFRNIECPLRSERNRADIV